MCAQLVSFAWWCVLVVVGTCIFAVAWPAASIEPRPDAHLPIVGKATGPRLDQALLNMGQPLDVLDD